MRWRLRQRPAIPHKSLDGRAMDLVHAGEEAIPQLNDLVGEDAAKVESELLDAIGGTRDSRDSWRAEEIRDILLRYPKAAAYLVGLVPAAKDPRFFQGWAIIDEVV